MLGVNFSSKQTGWLSRRAWAIAVAPAAVTVLLLLLLEDHEHSLASTGLHTTFIFRIGLPGITAESSLQK